MAKKKTTFDDIIKVIDKWVTDNGNDVIFHASFASFDKDYNVKDDIMFAYGPKEVLQIDLEGMKEEVDKEKEDFVNW
jgi:aminoglycoside N3'-acetyltransferase